MTRRAWGIAVTKISAITMYMVTTGAAQGETLFEALAASYNSNPTFRSQQALVRATDENVPQALSGWRPTVTVTTSAGVTHSDQTGRRDQQRQPLSGQLTVSQPLYRGGRTVAGTEQAEAQVLQARENLRASEQSVLLSAVTAYMDVLRDQARVELNMNNENVLMRQLEAARDRFEVGEVTRTDVAQAEARLSRATGDRVTAEGDLASSRATYIRVVGHPPLDLQQPPDLPPLPQGREEAVQTAIIENPSVVAARHNDEALGKAVRVAFGNLLPTANLQASVTRSDETVNEDVSNQSESLTAQLTIPLYQAGSVYSQVRQAKQQRSQARIQIEEAARSAAESATQAWENLVSARERIKSREEEVRANTIALEGVTQETAVGSRTTLDVLDAEQELLDARVALVIAKRDAYVAAYTLISAIGRLSAERLGLDVDLYDPTQHYQAVRDKLWGTSPPKN